ncbi:hypothetical protein MHYP_G00205140 [Metynnis hypsauchen]
MSRKTKAVHSVMEAEHEQVQEILSLQSQLEGRSKFGKQVFATMLIGEKPVKFQLDCGASCNIIPIQLLNQDTQLEKTKQVLVMYNKSTLNPLGKCRIKIRNPRNRKLYRLEFMVVQESSSVPSLGNKAVQAMDLVRIQRENILAIDDIVTVTGDDKEPWDMSHIQREYYDVFEGDGCLEGTYHIEVDPSIRPVQLPKRRVPVSLMTPLKEELHSLQERRIIAPVEKNESSYLTTFATPFGRYRWLRMPMGISPAPEVFQHRLTQALDGLPGVHTIADDILIIGEGENEEGAVRDHDVKLRKLLDRCRERNIKLNAEKFKLRQSEVPYIGHQKG